MVVRVTVSVWHWYIVQEDVEPTASPDEVTSEVQYCLSIYDLYYVKLLPLTCQPLEHGLPFVLEPPLGIEPRNLRYQLSILPLDYGGVTIL